MKQYSLLMVVMMSILLAACSAQNSTAVKAPAELQVVETNEDDLNIESTAAEPNIDVDQAIKELDSAATQNASDDFTGQDLTDPLGL